MPRFVARLGRGVRLWAVFALVAVALAACGGSSESNDPTPTAMPMSTQAAVTAPEINPDGRQRNAGGISRRVAGWFAGRDADRLRLDTINHRAEFQQQLFAAFPMETAAKQGGSLILGGVERHQHAQPNPGQRRSHLPGGRLDF